MTSYVAQHTATATIRTAEKLGATIPKNIAAGHARLLALADNRHAVDVAHDLPGAVVAALADGRDPATDPEVQRQTVLQAIAATRPAIAHAAADQAHTFVLEHADALLEMFRKPFDQAAAVIAEQAALGAPEPWGPAKTADQAITTIQQVWKSLAGVAAHLAVDSRYWPLTLADIPPAAFIDDNIASPGADRLTAWEMTRRGYPLSLATARTLADRIGAVHSEHQDRQQAYVEAGATAFRRAHGFGVGPAAA